MAQYFAILYSLCHFDVVPHLFSVWLGLESTIGGREDIASQFGGCGLALCGMTYVRSRRYLMDFFNETRENLGKMRNVEAR
jgi:hypothetical protein